MALQDLLEEKMQFRVYGNDCIPKDDRHAALHLLATADCIVYDFHTVYYNIQRTILLSNFSVVVQFATTIAAIEVYNFDTQEIELEVETDINSVEAVLTTVVLMLLRRVRWYD